MSNTPVTPAPQGDKGDTGDQGAKGDTGPPSQPSGDAGNDIITGGDGNVYYDAPIFAGAGTSGFVPDPVTEQGYVLSDNGTWIENVGGINPPIIELAGYEKDVTDELGGTAGGCFIYHIGTFGSVEHYMIIWSTLSIAPTYTPQYKILGYDTVTETLSLIVPPTLFDFGTQTAEHIYHFGNGNFISGLYTEPLTNQFRFDGDEWQWDGTTFNNIGTVTIPTTPTDAQNGPNNMFDNNSLSNIYTCNGYYDIMTGKQVIFQSRRSTATQCRLWMVDFDNLQLIAVNLLSKYTNFTTWNRGIGYVDPNSNRYMYCYFQSNAPERIDVAWIVSFTPGTPGVPPAETGLLSYSYRIEHGVDNPGAITSAIGGFATANGNWCFCSQQRNMILGQGPDLEGPIDIVYIKGVDNGPTGGTHCEPANTYSVDRLIAFIPQEGEATRSFAVGLINDSSKMAALEVSPTQMSILYHQLTTLNVASTLQTAAIPMADPTRFLVSSDRGLLVHVYGIGELDIPPVNNYVQLPADASAPAWLLNTAPTEPNWDSQEFTLSMWFEMPVASGFTTLFMGGMANSAYVAQLYMDTITLKLNAFDGVLNKNLSFGNLVTGNIYHILISFNSTADSTLCYINDELAPKTGSDVAPLSQIGISWSLLSQLNEALPLGPYVVGDIWADDTYLDISVEENRRKFIDLFGDPQDLGTNGELPTGSSPRVFIGDDMTEGDWNSGVNRGTDGLFDDGSAGWDSFRIFGPYPGPVIQNKVDASAPAWLVNSSPNSTNWSAAGFTASIWFECPPSSGTNQYLFQVGHAGGSNIAGRMHITSGGFLTFSSVSGGSFLKNFNVGFSPVPGQYYHVMWAFNWNVTGDSIVYINDVQQVRSGGLDNAIPPVSGVANHYLLCPDFQTSQRIASPAVSDIWIDDSFLDISRENYRRQFITANKEPVDLGFNGELPTGNSPLIFLGDNMVAADWNSGTNRGTDGSFIGGSTGWNSFTDV